MSTSFIPINFGVFQQYKLLAEKTFAQLSDEQLNIIPATDSNSIALIVKHLVGNMLSRWTHFLTTDGEKPNRQRDSEFEGSYASRAEMLEQWEKGWTCLFITLQSLTENDLEKIILIRGEKHTVLQAITRQIAHYSYHVGQIVYLGKMLVADSWQSLSIPKNKSESFNQQSIEQKK